MKYDLTTLGNRIKQCRKELHLTQTELAESSLLCVKKNTVGAWEKGNALPSLDTLFNLCEIFDCELGFLLGEFDTKTRTATDIHEAIGLDEAVINKIQRRKLLLDEIDNRLKFLRGDCDSSSMSLDKLKLSAEACHERETRFINSLLFNIDKINESVNTIIRCEIEMKILKDNEYYPLVEKAYQRINDYTYIDNDTSLYKDLCTCDASPEKEIFERYLHHELIEAINNKYPDKDNLNMIAELYEDFEDAYDLLSGKEHDLAFFQVQKTITNIIEQFIDDNVNGLE